MLLLDLPTELLLEIISTVDQVTDVYALCFTNKRLYNLSISSLYEHDVRFAARLGTGGWALESALLFNRTWALARCLASPHLPDMARHICWRKEDFSALIWIPAVRGHVAVVAQLAAHGVSIAQPHVWLLSQPGRWSHTDTVNLCKKPRQWRMVSTIRCFDSSMILPADESQWLDYPGHRPLARALCADSFRCQADRSTACALIKCGADMKLYGEYYHALYYACVVGFPDIVRACLERGASVNMQHPSGDTPLVSALQPLMQRGKQARRDLIETIEVLLEYGADVEAHDREGRSAKIIAAERTALRNHYQANRRYPKTWSLYETWKVENRNQAAMTRNEKDALQETDKKIVALLDTSEAWT
jgi:hypothetical protein